MNIAKRYNIRWGELSIKIALAGLIFALLGFIASGCVDAELKYDKAIITLADNRVIEVKVENARYGDTRFIDITADDGTEYRVHSMNVSFVKESQER